MEEKKSIEKKQESSTKNPKQKKDERVRNWVFLLWEDSAPKNWRDTLDNLHIQWVESPWHDKDVNDDGKLKKKHKHILLMFDGKKSYEQILAITEALNTTIPKRCMSTRGSARYMLHLDNPEKAQYKQADMIAHGGADLGVLLKSTSATRYELIREMISFINTYNITEFSQIATYAASERYEDWFPLLCDNSSYFIGQVIKSKRGNPSAASLIVDRKTGEVHFDCSSDEKGKDDS